MSAEPPVHDGALLSRAPGQLPDRWFQVVFENAHEAMALLAPDGRVLQANHEWVDLVGAPAGRLVSHHVATCADLPGLPTSATAGHVDGRRCSCRMAAVPRTQADGRLVYIEFSNTRLTIGGNMVELSIARNVTERELAKQALAASEQKYRRLVEQLPDVVWSGTPDGTITFISRNIARVCGFTPNELTGAPAGFWFARTHPEDVEALRAVWSAAAGTCSEVEFRWLARNSEWRWLRARVSQVTDETGRDLTHGIFIDVTEQKRLEEHIRQVQKMEALGQLTGGVAHDFNNILTVVVGNGELLRASLPEHDDRREDLDAILEAGERGAALTRQLMAFSRRDVREPRPIDLRQLVTTLAPMLRRVIGEDVRLSLSLEPGLPLVHADAGQLEQVLVNLAVNARNAMPTGGDLAISSQLLTLTDEYVDGPAPVSGQFVVLAVADTGCGMDDATRQRAFEPFFTTKPQGRGTGLGLSTCYGIIKQTDGHIHLDSAPDRGTTVRMYLPPMPGVEDESRPGEDRGQGGLTGQETILLVEDDAHVRATVERVLTGAGYHVITAVDGDHAQAVAVTTSGPIHLIVSDVVMPGAAGPEIVARLQSVLDGTKVLFMSGYTDHAQLRDGVAKSGAHFLRKPFAPVALLETVREVLDA